MISWTTPQVEFIAVEWSVDLRITFPQNVFWFWVGADGQLDEATPCCGANTVQRTDNYNTDLFACLKCGKLGQEYMGGSVGNINDFSPTAERLIMPHFTPWSNPIEQKLELIYLASIINTAWYTKIAPFYTETSGTPIASKEESVIFRKITEVCLQLNKEFAENYVTF